MSNIHVNTQRDKCIRHIMQIWRMVLSTAHWYYPLMCSHWYVCFQMLVVTVLLMFGWECGYICMMHIYRMFSDCYCQQTGGSCVIGCGNPNLPADLQQLERIEARIVLNLLPVREAMKSGKWTDNPLRNRECWFGTGHCKGNSRDTRDRDNGNGIGYWYVNHTRWDG